MTRRVKTPAAENRRSPGVTSLKRHSSPDTGDRPYELIAQRNDARESTRANRLAAAKPRKRGSTSLTTTTCYNTPCNPANPRPGNQPAMSDEMAKAAGYYPASTGIEPGRPPQDSGSRQVPHQSGMDLTPATRPDSRTAPPRTRRSTVATRHDADGHNPDPDSGHAGIDRRSTRQSTAPRPLEPRDQALPRRSGDRPARQGVGLKRLPFTPHTRGLSAQTVWSRTRRYRHPARTGDRPETVGRRPFYATPHEREWTRTVRRMRTAARRFPAHAGIDRT